ncbi:MAG: hypothetical protein ABMA15_14160 [Vicinamibacterales bacterium]
MAARLPRTFLAAIAVCGLFVPGVAHAQNQQLSVGAVAPTRHWSGQPISPVYEGFDVNADGSFNMWFGYMNRNFEEAIDLPVGPDNKFEPGLDRGQPTHFDTRRHKDIFKVTVPKDFSPTARVVWTLNTHGQSLSVAGTLGRQWQIDRIRTTRGGNINDINSNLPPVVTASAAAKTVDVGRGLTLNIAATDDGRPKQRGNPTEPRGMVVEWAKYRGPGKVTFDTDKQPLKDGKALTTATFSEPGEYTLMSVVDDGSGEVAGDFGYHCCWTNSMVNVTVTGAKPPSASTTAVPTFTKNIAPIFQEKCTSCHHAGTVAPMSLTTYEEVRPWARSIRARVASREMPPWHLDKTVGIKHYKNDLSLSDEQIATVLKWADAGAPAGSPADMPPPQTFTPEDAWHIGKPDLIVKMDGTHKMYANGPDWWIDYFGNTGLTEDRWIKAMEIKPGTRKIVHHVVTYVIEPDAPPGTPATGVNLHEYAVGKYGDTFNDNTGRLLKAGSRIRFDMHYFATGEALTDQTELAIVFYPKGYTPKYDVRSISFRNLPNDELEIPPNSIARHDGYFRLTRNVRLDAFQPHMHMRGKAMTLEAINLDNTVTVLSSVDHFDFGWHVSYLYADDESPLLPAGTMLHMTGVHDNTAANKKNPDPAMWAGYGERSVDDMLQVWLNVVYLDDAEYNRLVAERKAKQSNRTSTSQQQQQQ